MPRMMPLLHRDDDDDGDDDGAPTLENGENPEELPTGEDVVDGCDEGGEGGAASSAGLSGEIRRQRRRLEETDDVAVVRQTQDDDAGVGDAVSDADDDGR